jgi:bHLH factor
MPPPPVQDSDEANIDSDDPDKLKTVSTSGTGSGRTRGNRTAAMGTDEWARQRKDNHKEVERRRRGNINEGINELGRIVPNSSGEKAKGAILARAVQYIHHLKENEAHNIEKWTLEKLLMDQAMGDLQAQLEEMRRLWEEERAARQRAESELEVLRGVPQGGVASAVGAPPRPPSQPAPANYKSRSRSVEQQEGGSATRSEHGTRTEVVARPEEGGAESADRPTKRPRVD